MSNICINDEGYFEPNKIIKRRSSYIKRDKKILSKNKKSEKTKTFS